MKIIHENEEAPKLQGLTTTQREICTNMALKTHQEETKEKQHNKKENNEQTPEEQQIHKSTTCGGKFSGKQKLNNHRAIRPQCRIKWKKKTTH